MSANKVLIFSNASGEIINCDYLVLPTPVVNGLSLNVVTKTSSYTASLIDDIIICSNTTSMTITLPVASASGKMYNIKDSSNVGSVVVEGDGGDLIDDELNQTLSPYDSICVVDGTVNSWSVI